uniref:salivary glue protein Sgs-3-like n=1 Tax=Myxine glutinosa TaxID=7769 RepID=UPI00358E0091
MLSHLISFGTTSSPEETSTGTAPTTSTESTTTPTEPTTTLPPSTASCGGTFSAEGWLSSPGYPVIKHRDINCTWDITAPVGERVVLTVTDLQIDFVPRNEDVCTLDWLAVGFTKTTTRNITMCHSKHKNRTITAPSSFMRLFFFSSCQNVEGFNVTLSTKRDEETSTGTEPTTSTEPAPTPTEPTRTPPPSTEETSTGTGPTTSTELTPTPTEPTPTPTEPTPTPTESTPTSTEPTRTLPPSTGEGKPEPRTHSNSHNIPCSNTTSHNYD